MLLKDRTHVLKDKGKRNFVLPGINDHKYINMISINIKSFPQKNIGWAKKPSVQTLAEVQLISKRNKIVQALVCSTNFLDKQPCSTTRIIIAPFPLRQNSLIMQYMVLVLSLCELPKAFL